MKKKTLFFAAVAGFTAIAGQIIIMREFMIAFSGDELSVGMVLCSWLAGGAVGSLLLRHLAQRITAKVFVLWLCQIALSIYLPVSIFLIRSIRVILSANPGQILPFYILLASSFLLLLPVCATLGFIFPLLCRLYKPGSDNIPGGIAKVYAFESLGSMTGGLAASFIFIALPDSFQAVAILSAVNILSGFLLMPSFQKKRGLFFAINLFLLVCVLSLSFAGAWHKINAYSFQRQWGGHELLETKNTIYENLTVLKRGDGQTSFFGNGVRLYTVPDSQSSEEKVNFCLLEHGSAQDILLVGGGAGGLLTDILKHPVSSVTYLELDPEIVRMAQKTLPEEYRAGLNDKKVDIVNVDARYFVKNTAKRYDCVILDVGEPCNAFINRLYTRDFFKQLKRILKPGGIFSFSVSASESYINPESADYLRSIFLTLKSVFPAVIAIPGEMVFFIASDAKGTLTYDYNVLMRRAAERRVNLQYVREYYLSDRLSQEKVNYLEGVLNKNKNVMLNLDFRPSSYYYGIISWSSRFTGSLFTKFLRALDIKVILSGFLVIFSALIFFCRRPNRSLMAALAIGGFSQSVFQVVLIFSFQVIYGYLFYKIGLLFAFFMLGLFLSGWHYSRSVVSAMQARQKMLLSQSASVLFSVMIPVVLYRLSNTNSIFVSDLGSAVLFPALSLSAGLIEGYLFASVNQVYSAMAPDPGTAKIAGLTYGWDLAGACFGAALCAAFLIPIAGISITCFLLAALNILMLGMLVFLRHD
ncbi:MAG: fused MFS/spermidine synthase [Candidatus Omnitrophota bacterium]